MIPTFIKRLWGEMNGLAGHGVYRNTRRVKKSQGHSSSMTEIREYPSNKEKKSKVQTEQFQRIKVDRPRKRPECHDLNAPSQLILLLNLRMHKKTPSMPQALECPPLPSRFLLSTSSHAPSAHSHPTPTTPDETSPALSASPPWPLSPSSSDPSSRTTHPSRRPARLDSRIAAYKYSSPSVEPDRRTRP